jgi:hypothetical protein
MATAYTPAPVVSNSFFIGTFLTLTADAGRVPDELPVQRGFAIVGFEVESGPLASQIGAISPGSMFGKNIAVVCSDNTNTYVVVEGVNDETLFTSILWESEFIPGYTCYSVNAVITTILIGGNTYTQYYWAGFDPLGPVGEYTLTIS